MVHPFDWIMRISRQIMLIIYDYLYDVGTTDCKH